MPKQLLVVEDSVTIHRVVKITFAREDYEVTHAKSADDGIAKAKDLKPDLVLADAGMSGKTGYDLCAALRADGSNAAVLILTGNFAPYDEARGSKAGADGFVVKPFETQALIDKVNELVARKSGKPVAAASQPTMAMAAPVLPPTSPAPEPPKPAQVAAPPPAQPAHPSAPPPPPVRGWTMAMPTIQPATPLVPPAPPKPAEKRIEPVKAKDEGLDITIEPADVPKPAAPLVPPAPTKPAPLVQPVAKPVAPTPPLAKPVSPAAAPQASTMMMEAPKLPTPPAPSAPTPPPTVTPPVISPKEAPQASTMMMEAPKLPAPAPAPVVAKPSTPTGQVRMQATISPDAPRMPRPSLIPHVSTPHAHAAPLTPPAPPKPSVPAPRSTIMGMPAINPNAIGAKPTGPSWSPPPTAPGIKLNEMMAKAEQFKKEAAAAAAAASEPVAAHDLSPLVAAVAEKAQAEIAVRSADVQIMTREIVEKIAWEVVPELAEVMLKEHVEKLAAGKK